MDIEKMLNILIQNEKIEEIKYIYYMLIKNLKQVLPTSDKNERIPLLMVEDGKLLFLYQDADLEHKYLISIYEEILIILQKIFYDNDCIYFYCSEPQEYLTKEMILFKTDEAILMDDEKMFKFYASKLNELR